MAALAVQTLALDSLGRLTSVEVLSGRVARAAPLACEGHAIVGGVWTSVWRIGHRGELAGLDGPVRECEPRVKAMRDVWELREGGWRGRDVHVGLLAVLGRRVCGGFGHFSSGSRSTPWDLNPRRDTAHGAESGRLALLRPMTEADGRVRA